MSDTSDENDAFGHDPDVNVYRVDYDPDVNVYRVDYDPACERPSLAVVSAVASITERDVTDLPLLQATLSPESLDDLFAPTERGRSRGPGRVEFAYHGFQVVVSSDGRIELRPTE